ncbi:MAG: hypothetical protein ABIG89_06790 [Candidatus Woesearchaeota archaeon]
MAENEVSKNKSEVVIYVPSGIQAVHAFDLWGTLVIQPALGPRVIEAFREVSEAEGIASESVDEVVRNYQAVLDGESWAAGSSKAKFVGDLEEPVWKAYAGNRVNVDFEGALYDDCLAVMDDIVRAGEGLCIITTGNSFWVPQALKAVNPYIGEKMGEVYFGNKSKPAPFDIAMKDITQKGGQLVSHTEDQIKGFNGLFDTVRAMNATDDEHLVHRKISTSSFGITTVYIERANLASEEQVKSAGISMYVRDLRDVPYTSMVKK